VENIMSSKLLTTRRGTVILGVIAAVLAAIVLLVYLNSVRNSTNAKTQPVSVLVAKSLILKGTPGNVVGTTGLYNVASIPKDQVKTGAFVDPASLGGTVALTDIYPGQQITQSEFGPGTGALTEELAPNQRAVVVSLGSPQSVGGQLVAGDHVDVWIAFNGQSANGVTRPIVRLLYQDMTVLSAPTATNGSGNVTMEATPRQAGTLIYATNNAQIYLVLRPTVATKIPTRAPVVSSNDLLGLPPIRVGG
jgi:Flp pilus assembly protein CpaB